LILFQIERGDAVNVIIGDPGQVVGGQLRAVSEHDKGLEMRIVIASSRLQFFN